MLAEIPGTRKSRCALIPCQAWKETTVNCSNCGTPVPETTLSCPVCGLIMANNTYRGGNGSSTPNQPPPPLGNPTAPPQPFGHPVPPPPFGNPVTPPPFGHPVTPPTPFGQPQSPPVTPPTPFGQPQSPPVTPPTPFGQPQSPPARSRRKPRKIWLWIVLAVAALALIITVTIVLINVFEPNDTVAGNTVSEITNISSGDTLVYEPATSSGPIEMPPQITAEDPESFGTDFGTGTLVGHWSNIMIEGGFETVEFTEDGRFTLVDRDGSVMTGTYAITDGSLSGGTVKCSVDNSPLSLTGDFHLNGNILTWGAMMFQRDS